MSTIGITAGPTGAEPAAQMASDSEGGGRAAAPAEIGERSHLGARLRTRVERWTSSVWLPLALRAAGITAGMLGLAAIGAVSIVNGLDGRTKVELPLRADIHAAWVAAQSSSALPAAGHEHVRDGLRGGAEPRQNPSGVASSAPPLDGGAREPGITAEGKVILNLASAEELTRLPGVGPRRAQAIVQLRARLKRFRRMEDLLRVRGIGPRSLKRLLPHLVLDAPKPQADAGR